MIATATRSAIEKALFNKMMAQMETYSGNNNANLSPTVIVRLYEDLVDVVISELAKTNPTAQ